MKRIISFLAALALVFGTGAALPEGAVRLDTGILASALTYGDYEYTVLEDGTVAISGYSGSEAYLNIPAKIENKAVTVIGEYAFATGPFMGNENIVNVTLPDSITNISVASFAYCPNLESVDIPESVTVIGERAFWGCKSLKGITIPNSVTVIGGWAFCSCTGFSSVVIPRSVKSISENAFGYTGGSDKVDGFTIYGYSGTVAETYANNCGFEFIDLGKEYTYGDWVYTLLADGTIEIAKYQGSDTIVTVPAEIDGKKVTSIGAAFAVWNCKAEITEVKLPSGLKKIGAQAFSNRTALEKVNIPDSVESIGNSAFWCCTKLKAITLPDSVTSLDAGAFSGCEALESITLSENITSLNTFGFDANYYGVLSGCSKLKSVVIPKKVTVIDDYAVGYIMAFINGDNSRIEKVDGFTIYGYSGTAAEEYANKNGFTFIPLDAEPGDADGNGDVTVDDVLLIQQKIAGWDVKIDMAAADLDGDGKLSVSDALIVQQIIAGWKISV